MNEHSDGAQMVKERLSAILRIPIAKLEDATRIRDLVPESFAIVEMVVDIQDEFDIRLGRDDLGAVQTVGDLTTLVAARVAKR